MAKLPSYYESVANPAAQYQARAEQLAPKLYAPAYRAISQQFTPQFAQARNYLSANPAVANSGIPSRLNRTLMQGAYGALGQSLGQTSAGLAQGSLDFFGDLIRRRIEARNEEQKRKRSFAQQAGQVVGAGVSLAAGGG